MLNKIINNYPWLPITLAILFFLLLFGYSLIKGNKGGIKGPPIDEKGTHQKRY